ncbi:hypothetical protein NEOLEDRAFT_1239211 [Neolentinus lepideus HHB14362 ss-1]|uniref:Uncharacterized protein n=1 Tax=Neolentinus lepideus HHB14362 ss-1 TaxID=1314782 RepID=A0A165V672_9AGAM|nr:hypothetical protein NEOLEDRAFT_1239211 [Neolentinus lepideus HHB14362 ss-1]
MPSDVFFASRPVATKPPSPTPDLSSILAPQKTSGIGKKTRRPPTGCEISPSPFRPDVPAIDRLRAWTSPYLEYFNRRLRQHLSPLAANKTQELVFAALEPNTRTSCGAGLLRFHEFCDSEGIPESLRMPEPAYLLAAFVAWQVGTVSVSTIDNWLTAVRTWHDVNGARWEGDARIVSLVRTSALKRTPACSRGAKRSPVT